MNLHTKRRSWKGEKSTSKSDFHKNSEGTSQGQEREKVRGGNTYATSEKKKSGV